MKHWRLPLCGLCILILLHFELANAATLRSIYPGISLRYDSALPAQRVEQLTQATANGMTFWMESTLPVRSAFAEQETTTLRYRGNAEMVWRDAYSEGQAPAALDPSGCALSEPLAWQLFGSTEVLGLTVTVDEKDYTVRGVLAEEKALLLLPTTETEGFTAIELAPDAETWNDPAHWVSALLQANDLPRPSQSIYGGEVAALAQAAAWMPLAFSALLVLWQLVRTGVRWSATRRETTLFAVLLLFATLLPSLLRGIPAWLTPTRWSDFSWWGALGAALEARVTQWLSVCPTAKDVLAKQCLLRQTVCLFAQWNFCLGAHSWMKKRDGNPRVKIENSFFFNRY